MTILGTCGVVLILGFFFWMVVSSSNDAPLANSDDRGASHRVGYMTGLQGGSIEDAAISKFALNRARGNAANANARDVATATSMQINSDLD